MDAAKRRQQYWAIKEQLTTHEKKIIKYYELQWAMRHHVPTVTEIASYLQLGEITVNYSLNRRPVIKALKDRGIPFQQHTQSELTTQQVATAIVMMNFNDVRSNPEKLDQLGINPNQYNAWLSDPQFKNLIDSLVDQNLTNIKPVAITELTKKINSGDMQAIKFYIETTGAFQSQEQPQSANLIMMLIEIIQKHVKDPEVINAIAQDIKLASGNRTLEAAPQITGSIIDVELEDAKKKLGIS